MMHGDGGAQAGPGKAGEEHPKVPSARARPHLVLSTKTPALSPPGLSNLTQPNQAPHEPVPPNRRHHDHPCGCLVKKHVVILSLPSWPRIFHPVLRSVCNIYPESIHCQHFGSILIPSCPVSTFVPFNPSSTPATRIVFKRRKLELVTSLLKGFQRPPVH